MRDHMVGYNSGPIAVTVADLNNDIRLDLVITNSNKDNIMVLFGYGDGTFPFLLCASENISHLSSVAVGDFNNDDRLDISIGNFIKFSVDIFLDTVMILFKIKRFFRWSLF